MTPTLDLIAASFRPQWRAGATDHRDARRRVRAPISFTRRARFMDNDVEEEKKCIKT